MYSARRGMGDVCAFGDLACYAAALSSNPPSSGDTSYTVVGPPALTPNDSSSTCAYNDLACLQAAVGITQSNPSTGVCLSGDTACLAQVAGMFKAPSTQPPSTPAPFCGANSKQWIQGVDNCTLLELGGAAFALLLLLASAGSGRRRR